MYQPRTPPLAPSDIKNFGSPNGLCSSITESKHIIAVKRPWRRTNKHTALPQMLKVNERLDKLAAARADFTARGMLADSCLVQAFKNAPGATAGDGEDVDEDSYESDETNSHTSYETRFPGPDHPDTCTPHDTGARSPDDMDTCTPDDTGIPTLDTDTHAPNNAGSYAPGIDEDGPCSSNQDSQTLPNDEDDNDHGPVDSGPLMNEVRLACKKG